MAIGAVEGPALPGGIDSARLTRWARQSLARLRARSGRPRIFGGRFRLSPRLGRAERLVRSWVAALEPQFQARLPRLEIVPADSDSSPRA